MEFSSEHLMIPFSVDVVVDSDIESSVVINSSHPVSSSGQSLTPLHHNSSGMQISLDGQIIFPVGHGTQEQSQLTVVERINPYNTT